MVVARITPGPDRALWFLTFPGGMGRITTTGAVTLFPTPRQPFAFTTGPDGNLWFDPAFAGGVTVAAADLDCDGRADVLVGAGAGSGPHIRAFDAVTGAVMTSPVADTYAYSPTFTGGVFVAARGCAR